MPKKIRELKRLLKKAGFVYPSAKGSHTRWCHPLLPQMSGESLGQGTKSAG
ncbi:MAG: type II toxin-antitoxin system HicA family toxin [Crocosphaera sp.]|nr:type II toxin-antitoxin system HicA family toxin [Crocosphaera sp.]